MPSSDIEKEAFLREQSQRSQKAVDKAATPRG